jgi:hypothetical protein
MREGETYGKLKSPVYADDIKPGKTGTLLLRFHNSGT